MSFTREEMLISALGSTPLEVCESLMERALSHSCCVRSFLEESTGVAFAWSVQGGERRLIRFSGAWDYENGVRLTGAAQAFIDLQHGGPHWEGPYKVWWPSPEDLVCLLTPGP